MMVFAAAFQAACALAALAPVEEDTFLVDGIPMSNFLHPSWFEPFKHPPGTKFDHLGLLTKPFSMTKGGYVIFKKKGKVSEVFASKAKERRFAQEHRYLLRAWPGHGAVRPCPGRAQGEYHTGWIVVEQDVLPGLGTPAASARRNREYLRRLGL